MSYRIGLVGPENSGKSFSRSFIKNPKEMFIIQPSQKALHFTIDGKHPPRLNLAKGASKTTKELTEKFGVSNEAVLVDSIVQVYENGKIIENLEVSGNYALVQDLAVVGRYLKLINFTMPDIKLAVLPDFTHYISTLIGSTEFIIRKEGGEAYQRYLDLAASVLNNFFTVVDTLREDLLVVTEYHSEFDPFQDKFVIFSPGGKMVQEKFKPASYYDTLLYTHYEEDEKIPYADRFKFVTRKWRKYDGRSLPGCFEQTLIPNNLQLVCDTMRNHLGLS